MSRFLVLPFVDRVVLKVSCRNSNINHHKMDMALGIQESPGSLPKPHLKESILKCDLTVNATGKNNNVLIIQ